jgi:hypothetical protein
MAWAAIAIGAGTAISAGSSYLGAQSGNRAQSRAQNQSRRDEAQHQNLLGSLQLGPEQYRDLLRATGNKGELWFLDDPTWQNLTPQAQQNAQARFFSNRPTLDEAMRTSGQRYLSDLEGNLASEQRTTGRLDALATQNEQAGQDLTAGEIARISRDSQRQLTNLNRQSSTQLGLMGVSSLGASQQANNTRMAGEQRNNAILGAKSAGVDRFQRGRSTRLGLLSGRTGLEGDLQRNLAGARQGVALQGPQSLMNLMGGGNFQPFNYQPVGGQSAVGSAAGSLGSGLSTLGGFLALSGQGGQGAVPRSYGPNNGGTAGGGLDPFRFGNPRFTG